MRRYPFQRGQGGKKDNCLAIAIQDKYTFLRYVTFSKVKVLDSINKHIVCVREANYRKSLRIGFVGSFSC